MKIADKLPYFIVAGFAWIVIISSCANQGMPTGGPKDSIPPLLVSTEPDYKALNVDDEEVRLTFNEYIIPDAVSEMLVISPPLEKRPTILTKSKTLIIRFNEELKDSTTYSLDFKNSVVDNNERNPLEGLRFSFSTGEVYDSLRVAGRVINSFDLEPVEQTLVMLYSNLHDSAIYTVLPDYIAETDEQGNFLVSNIAPGKYHLFSITDINSDLKYNEGAEKIAFADSIIVPGSEFHSEVDTLVSGVDSLLIEGHTHFFPGPKYLRQFKEDLFEQYVKQAERNSRYQSTFVFNESVRDTFVLHPLESEIKNWYKLEYNEKFDSLIVWFADTLLASKDTFPVEFSYFQLDSTNQIYLQTDTTELIFTEKKEEPSRRRREKEEEQQGPKPVEQFTWKTNIQTSGFNLNEDIILSVPQPLKSIDTSGILLYLDSDTLKTPLDFKFSKDTIDWRTYRISYNWEPQINYILEIDSAAAINIYEISSKKFTKSIETQAEDYYGTINFEATGITEQVIIQLLENNEGEEVITEKIISENKIVVFDFLDPGKYKIKIIYDQNKNGKWDTGSFQDKYQPERVAYINEVIKIRSNWDSNLTWNMEPDPTFTKNIRDKELEEQMRKEAEEKARKEREGENSRQPQQRNSTFGPGGRGGSFSPTNR